MAEMYDCQDSEELTCETPDEAVERYLDDCPPEEWPEVLHVMAWDRMEITEKARRRLAGFVLEHLCELLADDYAGDDPPEPTEAMGAAALAFVDAVVPDYPVWRCERVCRDDEWVPVAAWVRAEHPEWIEEDPEARARIIELEELAISLTWPRGQRAATEE